MFHYWAYGLNIHSAFLLPELQTATEEQADVVIRPASLAHSLPEAIQQGQSFWITPHQAYLSWAQVGVLLIREGREILVDAPESADQGLLRLQLLGAGLAILLYQRQLLVLHASSVAIAGQVVAFLGEKGQGKSTLAATLFGRGHTLIADDVIPLDLEAAGKPITWAGFPQFKLLPDAVAALGSDPEAMPRIHANFEKRSHRVTERFSHQKLPLQQIIVLSEGAELALKRLSAQAAFPQMMQHWYLAAASSQLLQGDEAIRHFRQITALIERVPIYCLERPRSLDLLTATAELIENNVLDAIDPPAENLLTLTENLLC